MLGGVSPALNAWMRETKALWVLLMLCVLGGCSATSTAGTPAYSVVGPEAEEVDIPPGHMPPPRSCRVWFPGEPPGQQPPPGECEELERSVPRGAWLYRPDEERRVYRIG